MADGVVTVADGLVTVADGLWHIGDEQFFIVPLEVNLTSIISFKPTP